VIVISPHQLVDLLWHRDPRCFYCQAVTLRPGKFRYPDGPPALMGTGDHYVSRAAGGNDQAANIVLACWSCNQRKGSRRGLVFLEELYGGPTHPLTSTFRVHAKTDFRKAGNRLPAAQAVNRNGIPRLAPKAY
jgi:hypothetical protein